MRKLVLLFSVLLATGLLWAQSLNTPALIPYPAKLVKLEGNFQLSPRTQIRAYDQGLFTNELHQLQLLLQTALGSPISLTRDTDNLGQQTNTATPIIQINYNKNLPEGGYNLDINTSDIKIEAGSASGLFYAIQSLRQLLPVEVELGKKVEQPIQLPALSIQDKPAFEWRGSMIDVSRHFFSVEYIKKHIDRLALYKMNKLHLHLSDDQGWRVEIKKYPKLTSQGAWRYYNNQDSSCIKQSKNNPDFEIDPRYIIKREGEKDIYGGYFTQEQLKELVRYAGERHIEIIPEIDMPGHMATAISAYPFLTDSEKGWGKSFSVPICPCKDSTYTFVEDVLSEIMEIFPSQYIHIGADEVEKTSWEKSPRCRDLMTKEGIKSVDELQSYFVHRIQNFVESKGKKLIAWDEALEGGINSNVDIMYWRGWVSKAPAEATTNGNQVIMTPTNPLYFDYLPDKSSLRNVYTMDVIYKNVLKDKAHLIRGAQANMWAETIPSENRADFMLFPRLTALAERVWTNQDLFESYSERLIQHYPRLDNLNVNYRLPDVDGFAFESVYVKEALFDITSPLPEMKIHYTMDGSIPNRQSTVLDKAVKINKPTQIKFALFSPGGVRGEIYTINYKQTPLAKALGNTGKINKKGLECAFYNKAMDKTTLITGSPDQVFTVTNFDVPSEVNRPSFGLQYTGYLKVPETGIYSFYFTCDDSGMLYIADRQVIDNEGPHPPVEKSGQVALSKGYHPIKLNFVEGGGGYTLKMQYSVNNGKVQDIPDSWFFH